MILGISGSVDHESWELWIQKANMEPDMGWVLGMAMFCCLKLDVLDLKPIHGLEKQDLGL